jgi:ABC-type antimicrobial peptide transport system permease subunit
MDLGYNMENLVFFSTRGELSERYETAKNEFLQIPGVMKVSAASAFPTGGRSNSSGWQWEGKDPEVKPSITMMSVDSDYLETFEIPLIQGRFFRKENDHSGNTGDILINDKLAGIIGRENPINTRMSYSGRDYTIIGVIKDYIPNPRWRVDEPLALLQMPEDYRFIFLKIEPENIPHTLAQVKNIFEQLNPAFPFEYEFLDTTYEIQFSFVHRTRSLIAYLAGFAIFISCLGLFGLASFNAEQKTKEIGIRKVLGSSVSSIVMLLSKDLTRLVLLANIIAWPAAWYLLNRWLQSFLYRTHIRFDIFIVAGTLTFFIALVTISYQSIKAATANPVDSLRYE